MKSGIERIFKNEENSEAIVQKEENIKISNNKFGTAVSMIPSANWNFSEAPLKYVIDRSAYMIFEGSFWHNSGFNFGLSADTKRNADNALEIQNILGYLGFGRGILKIGEGKISGTASWNGAPISGQPHQASINTSHQSISLLFLTSADTGDQHLKQALKEKSIMEIFLFSNYGLYLGLNYTSYKLPRLVEAYHEYGSGQSLTNKLLSSAYDNESSIGILGFVLGWDNSRMRLKKSEEGLFIWMPVEAIVGLAFSSLSNEGKRRVKENLSPLDKKEDFKDSDVAVAFSADMIFGLSYIVNIFGLKTAISAGYNYMFSYDEASLSQYDSDKDNPKPRGYYISSKSSFSRDGWIFRLMMQL
ncbi:MAG: hypothetical protein LBV16_05640 [Elusimicrobiota bacterium]|nr:hypothetical protein [Elusimicrobiota bacterium]